MEEVTVVGDVAVKGLVPEIGFGLAAHDEGMAIVPERGGGIHRRHAFDECRALFGRDRVRFPEHSLAGRSSRPPHRRSLKEPRRSVSMKWAPGYSCSRRMWPIPPSTVRCSVLGDLPYAAFTYWPSSSFKPWTSIEPRPP